MQEGEPYTAHAEHGIGLAQLPGAGCLPVVVIVTVVGKELVHRCVQETHRHRTIPHRAQQVAEVLALSVGQGRERLAFVLGILGKDHPADQRQSGAEKLVFGPAQPDALGAQPHGARRVSRGVGVGPHPEPAVVVGPAEQDVELGGGGCRANLDRADVDVAGASVNGDDVAFA